MRVFFRDMMDTDFLSLGLDARIVQKLAGRGITAPTPIQAAVFAPAAEGRDVLARSRTGSGKTLAFGLPLLGRLSSAERKPQMLVLTPTRELAVQVAAELEDVAKLQGLTVAAVIGGASMRDQARALGRAQVVVGTPGRILDHIGRGTLGLDGARAIVLDEGDEMLDMGFLDDIRKILEDFPAEGQRLLFSATVPPAMRKVIADYLRDPVTIETDRPRTAHAQITHAFFLVRANQRYEALANVLLHEPVGRALIFTQTKQESQEVALRLGEDGFSAAFLNGDLSQDQRTAVMEAFRAGRTTLLVATDVAARGIDVKDITHVVNYSLPGSAETYVHRTGRTGRAGATGTALSIVALAERGKAFRYAKAGHFEPVWRDVPDAEAIEIVRTQRLRDELQDGPAPDERAKRVAAALLRDGDAEAIVAALVARVRAAGHPGYEVTAAKVTEDRKAPFKAGAKPAWTQERPTRGAPAPRRREEGMASFRIGLGERHRLSPGALIQLVCKATGLQGSDFGRITIGAHQTFFDVKSAAAAKLAKKNEVRFGGKVHAIKPSRT